jgi:hypothetical protein
MSDQVAAMSVEGVNKSAIARVQQIAWNTVDRWLEKAAASCRRFNHVRISKIRISELQDDEICTLVGGKEQPFVWIFAAIEVWSRLWPSTVVGKRSYRNTHKLFRDLVDLCQRFRLKNDILLDLAIAGPWLCLPSDRELTELFAAKFHLTKCRLPGSHDTGSTSSC